MKCHVLHLGRKLQPPQYQFPKIESPLDQTKSERDLGVITDSELNFSEHITQQINKANKIMGIIRRTFKNLTSENFKNLYQALVRPHLDYASSIWSPHQVGLTQEIEKVQRRATKLVPELSKLPYPERLRRLKMTTLRHRRTRGDLIESYKIFNTYSLENTILGS